MDGDPCLMFKGVVPIKWRLLQSHVKIRHNFEGFSKNQLFAKMQSTQDELYNVQVEVRQCTVGTGWLTTTFHLNVQGKYHTCMTYGTTFRMIQYGIHDVQNLYGHWQEINM